MLTVFPLDTPVYVVLFPILMLPASMSPGRSGMQLPVMGSLKPACEVPVQVVPEEDWTVSPWELMFTLLAWMFPRTCPLAE